MWELAYVARELAPARVRSARKFFGAASQPSGSKLPRHRKQPHIFARCSVRAGCFSAAPPCRYSPPPTTPAATARSRPDPGPR
ncbi:hypothetical protein B5P22_22040 [Pseudomonas tolaasii]|nr:hypothetical protein B5P22_22040 [Pseudomonas tolaasii]